ncbi:MAG: succinylglutamate desuccinylase, partial [Oscillospiraceae bacterium]|nr:succinylglutamate desuccinylase [Oscillospiraceae bacterium]
ITISAGVHSREYIGIETLILLGQELTPEMMRGTILLLHCCNYEGFLSRSSDVMPQDGKNLNRVFPGAADGTPTQKLAAFLESEIIGHTDYLVDLHSGGFCEALVPHVYYHGAAKPSVCAESFRIAEMTSAKFLVRSETKNGFYSHAGQCGVPAIILERGGCGLLHEEEVRQDLADVKNILRGLGFLLDLPAKVYPHRLAQNGRYLDAPVSGCWYPKKQPGDRIRTGELLGEIRDIYAQPLHRVFAETDGVVLYQTASLGIEAGTPMIAYAELEKEV